MTKCMHFSTEAAIRLGKGVVESPGPRTGQWESYLHSTTNKNECGHMSVGVRVGVSYMNINMCVCVYVCIDAIQTCM